MDNVKKELSLEELDQVSGGVTRTGWIASSILGMKR